ncbi:MAG: nitroreductase family protein [Lachnospiraceae bacterium]|nr:nitroreductase family protein [Lachnospiraceae bacterium]
METLKTINTRKSTRSYTGALSDAALQTVLQAGQAAPIGMGKFDTMHMTVIRDKDLLHEIDRAAAGFFGDPSRTPLYGAPCLILISTPVPDPANGNVSYSNAAIMTENMSLAATDLGLGSCLIWGAIAALNQTPELVAKLNLPEEHTVCCGIVLGETTDELTEREIPSDRISVSYL